MPRKTHIPYKNSVSKLDSEIARLQKIRDDTAQEDSVDVDALLHELCNVTKFHYQYGTIWFATTAAMRKILPKFIGGQESYNIPLAMGVSLELTQGNHLSLFSKDKNPNSILPFLKKHGVKRSAIEYSHAIHWRDEAVKELKKEQAEVDAIEAALKKIYAT